MNRIALLLAAVLVAGCAIDQGKFSGLTDQSHGPERALDTVLDRVCEIKPGSLKDDRPGDPGRIKTRTEIALRKLERALKEADADPGLFHTRRADLVLAILDQAEAAAKPTTRTLIGFLRLPSISDARELIKNALEDKLYGLAYQGDCGTLFPNVAQGGQKPLKKHWQMTQGHVVEQCDRLTQLTSGDHKCTLSPGTYPFGNVQ